MSKSSSHKEPVKIFSTKAIISLPMLVVFALFLVSALLGFDSDRVVELLGLHPMYWPKVYTALTFPLVHGSWTHWISNFFSLAIATYLAAALNKRAFWRMALWGYLLSGLLSFIIARQSIHIGASGLAFYVITYVMVTGIRFRRKGYGAFALITLFLFAGSFATMFPNAEEGISWEGHLGGFIAGFVASYLFPPPLMKLNRAQESEDESASEEQSAKLPGIDQYIEGSSPYEQED